MALLDRDSEQHTRAAAEWRRLRGTGLMTHNYIVVETVAVLHRLLGPAAFRALVEDLVPAISVEWVDERLHEAAVSAMLAGLRRRVSLVDWVSFELMRRRRIDAAFAFDRDFAAQGFSTIP